MNCAIGFACAASFAAVLVSCSGAVLLPDMVYIPGGKFKMGSPENEPGRDADEGPARDVEVKPFWIGKHEITWEQYQAFWYSKDADRVDGKTHPSEPFEPPDGGMGEGRHPAVNIRWQAAKTFCEWLSKKTGRKYRLPTEAEWEYAARAGDTGAAPSPLGDYAWHAENSKTDKRPKGAVHEAGRKKPNAFGLYDMLGNVWEYALEPYDDKGKPVVRGGAWDSPAKELRYANRQKELMAWSERDPNRPRSEWWLTDALFVGFRIARDADEK